MRQTFPMPETFPLDQVAELHSRLWTRRSDEPIATIQGTDEPLYGSEYMLPEIDPWVKRLCAEIVALQKRVAELEERR